LAGFGLVAGACSSRTIGSSDTAGTATTSESEASGNSQTGSSTDPDSSTESESDDSECSQTRDCPPGYYCLGGICEYQIAPDGTDWYECYEPDDCDPLSLCVYNQCEPIVALPDCSPNSGSNIRIGVDGSLLALSFVDLDADTAAELVVARPTDLHVFESGSDIATVSARVYESTSVTTMVGGDFDPGAGQDLALLVDDTLLIHASDGIAGFDSPSASASPEIDSAGMLAGEFDGVPPSDLMVWSPHGASVIAGSVWDLLNDPVEAATAVDSSFADGRFVLQTFDWMYLYELDGSALADFYTDPSSQGGFLISIVANAESLDLDATSFATWTMLELRALAQPRGRWGVSGVVSAMAGGDLDGDGNDEVALILDGGVTLVDELESGRACSQWLDLAGQTNSTHLAFGDWDGDGDDELAVGFSTGEIAVFDEG
jgi:hypothetical protein